MNPWKRLSEKKIRINRFRSLIKVRCELPTGKRGDFYLQDGGKVVCALVLTRERRIVLVEQYRLGPDEVMLELPGGRAEPGEFPRRAIEREVLEEAGYRGKVQLVATSNDDAWTRKLRYHFVITGAVKVAEPKNDELEHTEVRLLSLAQFRRHLRSGKLTDIETGYLGLDFLKLL